jgi:hypothetical protein
MSLSAKMSINPYMQDDAVSELSRLTDTLNLSRGITFSEGVGANQVNMVFHDQRTLTDAANETLAFNDGSLTNKVGISITMDILKALYIKNTSTEADLIIGNATNPMAIFGAGTYTIEIKPDGEWVYVCPDVNGIDITTNDELRLEHDGTGTSDLIYDIIVLGVDSP